MTPPGAPLEKGYRLGKYEVIGRISVGGMAELYLAYLGGQGGFRKFVALKRVLPSVAEQDMFMKMFLDEARITATLSHANIAQVFELAEAPDNREPVLAMEFVAGQNLGQVAARARKRKVALAPAFFARVMHDVLLGLQSAHHFIEPTTGKPMPVVHRDINPRNIMITYTGGVKIIDFGIAKARGRLDTTQVGMVKGTLQYMSPEQVMQKEVDGRSDLFAASVVLYELLSGTRLFDESNDIALFNRILQGDVRPLGEVAPTLPPALVEVVMKGLSRNPNDRWKTGREYARALDHALPELFDDGQVAEVMAKLFEDKIAATRSLLQSTTTDASFANLKLMTQVGEESDSRPALPSPPPPLELDVPTNPHQPKMASPTMVLDRPVGPGPTERTEANLAPVGDKGFNPAPFEEPTGEFKKPATTVEPVRKPTGNLATAPVEPVRKPTGTVPAATRKKTSDSQKKSGDSGRNLSGDARRMSGDKVPAAPVDPNEPITDGEAPVLVSKRARSGPQQPPARPGEVNWALWIGVVVSVLALAWALSLVLGGFGSRPEDVRPLQLSPPKKR